ncbi:hypothetical protein [Alteraurantiacibacter buctensis]|uniref:Uncharacterized protein n=1 Tax=Alteraurantiacibacter buctensis TaxID=1503981 RepID=A0A844YWG9_9SPHN|nr:hypothetical protein [Alteraurantiacibacter buctensis]MXO70093.1 hypothetical protein [Alteraurantiacibacter buctensis]
MRRDEQEWWPDEDQVAAALSRHAGVEIDPTAVDDISCEGFVEEPSGVECHWLQDGEEKRWQEELWHGVLARDGQNWALIDDPYQRFVPTRIDRIDGYHMNGATVLLHGLLRCGAFGCWISGNGSGLGISGNSGPGSDLARLAGQRVYLRAIVTDLCVRRICVDQAPTLNLVEVSSRPMRN